MSKTSTVLTPSLAEALPYVRAGMTGPQIGALLGISTEAARARISRLVQLGMVDRARGRRGKAVGTLASVARSALAGGAVPPTFRLPDGLPAPVRAWLDAEARTCEVPVEDVVRGVLVDAYLDSREG